MADPVVIVAYDPGWPATFATLRDRARVGLGDVAQHVEHIGSTSVPGLAAKPIIDLVVVVRPDDVGTGIARLEAIGYRHRGNLGVEGREAFAAPDGDPPHHLYLSPDDSEELRAQLAFRDRLRTDADLRTRYEALKRRLARTFTDDRSAYTEAKTSFVVEASRP